MSRSVFQGSEKNKGAPAPLSGWLIPLCRRGSPFATRGGGCDRGALLAWAMPQHPCASACRARYGRKRRSARYRCVRGEGWVGATRGRRGSQKSEPHATPRVGRACARREAITRRSPSAYGRRRSPWRCTTSRWSRLPHVLRPAMRIGRTLQPSRRVSRTGGLIDRCPGHGLTLERPGSARHGGGTEVEAIQFIAPYIGGSV